MREWLKANGGPPGLIVVGGGLSFAFWPLGVAVVALGIAMWLNTWDRVPLVIVSRRSAKATAQSDAAIVAEAKRLMKALGELIGQHMRYIPPTPNIAGPTQEARRAQWEQGSQRRQEHEQKTIAQFYEDHYADITLVVGRLYERRALSKEEARHINWTLGGTMMGSAHSLGEIAPSLATAVYRLETGRLLTSEDAGEPAQLS